MVQLSRRDFLKLTGTAAFFASLNWDELIKKAIAEVKSGGINIVWFEAQDCAGNTTALIQATKPDLVEVLGGYSHIAGPGTVKLLFHETVMLSWGEETPEYVKKLVEMSPEELAALVEKLPDDDPLKKTLKAFLDLGYNPGLLLTSPIDILKLAEQGKLDPFVLVLEGSFPIDEKAGGPPHSDYFCYIGEENGKPITCTEWMRRLLPRAVAVISVGNCACYGGIPANKVVEVDFMKKLGYDLFQTWTGKGWSASPTGAVGFFPDPVRGFKGLVDLLEEAEPFRNFVYGRCSLKPGEIRPDCRPAVSVPGCPANGNGQLRVIANLILWAKGLLPLPELDQYWRPKYIFGPTVHEQCPRAGSYAAGDFRKEPGDPDYKCLFAVGCKGPISNCPWNKVGWVEGVGGPTRAGGVCIGCTMPGFSDSFEGFYKPLQAPTTPSTASTAASAAVAAVAGAAVAYGVSKMVEKKAEKAKEEQTRA
ncbi:hyaluronate lyase [Pyrodictium delaneyi]|uniref:Hyaluronate lyase n=1 Tax=Pyrodictium delaneyi TaxID=1273541 RepID=A0A0P0N204_9CREN|nr:hyaluronate lyase [Pyrodictium delaneyi]ALL00445.1 hyaluronate lyase [Pyrodictium delaneyi]OWJ53920.1 hyaluronate lyase [Pyrodictium delaneyi]